MPFDAQAPAEVTARDRLVQLRDFLETLPPERFDMHISGFVSDAVAGDCGTPACIGGWARALFKVRDDLRVVGFHLGLSEEDSGELFYWLNTAPDLTYDDVTLPMAVAVLDHYLATGKIDWSVA